MAVRPWPKPPAPPRSLKPPRPPVPPRARVGRLHLAPTRSADSLKLDETLVASALGEVPFVRWDQFLLRVRFKQGEHITIVGTTGSGKTVMARELIDIRDFAAVLGTKRNDPELYGPLEARGFVITDHFDAEPDTPTSRVIFRPRLATPDKKGLDKQQAAFEGMLFAVWEAGGWAIYIDEAWYITNRLKLGVVLETFWSGGRSENITVIVATQLPVDIPLMAFDQATHLLLFKNTDKYRINRMAEFAGGDVDLVRRLIPLLPRHEALYVNTRDGLLLRTKVLIR